MSNTPSGYSELYIKASDLSGQGKEIFHHYARIGAKITFGMNTSEGKPVQVCGKVEYIPSGEGVVEQFRIVEVENKQTREWRDKA